MKNEALQLYDEAFQKAAKKGDVQVVKTIRSELKEKIGEDRDAYLLYKVRYSVNNPIISLEGMLSVVIAVIAIVLSICSFLRDLIGQAEVFSVIVSVVGSICMAICVIPLFRIFFYLKNFHKYRVISCLLEEIEAEMDNE